MIPVFLKNIQKNRKSILKLMLITLSFALIVYASYMFMVVIEYDKFKSETENLISGIETCLESGYDSSVSSDIDALEESYYKNIYIFRQYLLLLGFFFTIVLGLIFIYIVKAGTRAEEYAKVLIDAMPFCANFWNHQYKNISTNEEAVRFFELSGKQEYLDRFFDLSPEYQPDGMPSKEKAYKLLDKAFNEGYCRFEWMHQKLNGELLPCEVTLVRNKYKGRFIVTGYTRDLRESKAKELAEKNSYNKSAFLANISHEIRTPMNTILGIAEIQLQKEKLSEDSFSDVHEAFNKIIESGNQLLRIINDILDLSKIETGKLEITEAAYNIPNLVNDTIQLSCMHINDKEIDFEIDIDKNTPLEALGDELRIKQILNNILSNSFKYTDKGKISFSLSVQPYNEEKVMLVFRVIDTGHGMTSEQIKKLFNEYARFNTEANLAVMGAGLGMSITKHLVDMMGGEIFAESSVGKGTAVTVRLPQKPSGNEVCTAEIADKLKNFKFRNTALKSFNDYEYMPYGSVLIVDDVLSNIYVAKGLLNPYGVKIETACSGFEAIEKIKNGNEYDIIFMDHMMPKMSGLETVKIIRETGYTEPIIALTANAIAGQKEFFLNNGFDGFLPKPINSKNLNNILNEFIFKKQPFEIIEKARQEKESQKSNLLKEQNNMPDLLKYFIKDAEKSINIIKDIYINLENSGKISNDELKTYTITVHGIKTALANVNENELSDMALNLEEAGIKNDIVTIINETPAIIGSLQKLKDKYKKKINEKTVAVPNDIKLSSEDIIYIKEKFLKIKTACDEFNKNEARKLIDELKQKILPRSIHEILEELAAHLLHSTFKKASVLAEEAAETIN